MSATTAPLGMPIAALIASRAASGASSASRSGRTSHGAPAMPMTGAVWRPVTGCASWQQASVWRASRQASSNTVHLITFWWYSVLGAKASPRGHLMNVTTVESTSLATVAYDDARKLLQLEFCSRAIYQYFGVPAAVHAALLRAPSKGIYFNRVIRGGFPYSLGWIARPAVPHAPRRSECSR